MIRFWPVLILVFIFSCSHTKSNQATREEVSVSNLYQSADFNLSFKKEHADYWFDLYLNKSPDRLMRHLTNGEKFRPIVTDVLKRYGLPEDLFYVGLIESGFYLRSESHASAVGPWQFIRATGKSYGLRVDSSVDERMNIFKSTVAAAKYFKYLYGLFDNWELALCAYNAGENRVKRAIKKGGTKNYLELVELGLLPKETIYYVPKVVAMRHIERNLEKFGISGIEKNGELFETARSRVVSSSFKLSDLKNATNMSDDEMLFLNPDLKKEKVFLKRPMVVFITKKAALKEKLSALEIVLPRLSNERPVKKIIASTRIKAKRTQANYQKYVVRKGDNLVKIARKFNTTPQKILLANNNIKNDKLLRGQSIKVKTNTLD